MSNNTLRQRFLGSALALGIGAAIAAPFALSSQNAHGSGPAPAAQAVPVSVATVKSQDAIAWNEFSGRLEAVERVELRSRVAGAVQEIHFREGALVRQGDLLVVIDPAPYQAAVDAAAARVASAQSQLAWARKEEARGHELIGMSAGAISQSSVDQRVNAAREADASLRAAQADLQAAELNLGYTQIRAPVSGRVGKIEITVGNLIAAGPASPVLTSLMSVDPIYGSFDADEQTVTQALKALGAADVAKQVGQIPVDMMTADGTPIQGHLQLIDNRVDAQSGTVRLRAQFDNPNGTLIPGQFARLRMGSAKSRPVVAVDERALGTDQDKRFVIVIGADNKAVYREVALGGMNGNLRVISGGLNPGERVVVEGLQRVRPGAEVSPTEVPMDKTELTQR
ncbi:MAG TPA: efflux RND transporter periplasmic adaptor subunit [Alphaproteobacteria bacterium]|jgi:multidrug efflux system membrane fusion protein|nr:efflux RND transporter periplasmic adaptor subunit [Alphaproteobacteria bacterium]